MKNEFRSFERRAARVGAASGLPPIAAVECLLLFSASVVVTSCSANVVGLGGNSVRDQGRCLPSTPPYGCKGEWVPIYTNQQSATYGAQFIVFNAGSPKAANGYFKNVNGQTIDTFTITHD
jgi:hypothetical protein